MSQVVRIFVEKKNGFDVEASQILWDLKNNLGLTSLEELRLVNRYDISGLSSEELDKAKTIVFSEPNQDNVYDETLPVDAGWKVFAMEYLPGQYDQRADSAAQCAQLLTQGERPNVLSAKVVAVKGNITDEEFVKIQNYMINPVESRLASMEKPETLDIPVVAPDKVADVEGFITFSDDEMAEYYSSMGFAMTLSDLKFCRDYFRDEEKRNPTVTELRVIDTYWSDHCRHTTFLTRLEKIEIEKSALTSVIESALKEYYDAREEVYGKDSDRDVSLMDMALAGMKLLRKRGMIPDLDVSDEINACSIEVPVTIDGVTEQWLVQFKNETHNHPTEIEPFGGAATCLGGAIRDPLSGRSYVYQAMRVTGSGDPTVAFKDTMQGKLPSRKITTGAAAGYSSYGNQIGLATGQVVELYDPGYVAKRMEIGAVIGASPKSNVVRGVPSAGDVIVLLGGKTGRDGCGGATGSSKAHTESSIETCGAEVQKGNPPTERKIQRLFRNSAVSTLIKRCNDFGAGGVCVAIGELADGLSVDLDKVTKKYEGLDGTELAISESQERMAVVLEAKDVDKFIEYAHTENLEATAVAVVTENPRLTMTWKGDTIVSLSRAFLNTNGVTQVSQAYITAPNADENYRTQAPKALAGMSKADAFKANLSRLEVCSQIGLGERFDASIGAATVIMPFGGKYQLTPQDAMAAKIPLEKGETDDATAMSFGFIPGVSRWSPFHGSAFAVVESLSKLLAIGADPLTARLTFQEYFERLYDKAERWGKPAAALLGAMTAQINLGIPSIGGKDSMSGSFEDLDVPPTLVSFAVAMTKASKTISAEFKNAGSKVLYIPVPVNKETQMPIWDDLKKMYNAVYALMADGKVLSASVVREGGAAATVARMCFGNKIGFTFDHELTEEELFAPLSGSLVVELADGAELDSNVLAYTLGTTTANSVIDIKCATLDIDELIATWTGKLENVFATKADCPKVAYDIPLTTEH
ncbi:MAG: phosphoribosylformylglycinamidine synthase, partial [Acutalibacteraceae bacterium]|nr:phosphoribosylformylglycinamidine synthase [Acutalibacteraceae bacterium]